MVIVSLKNTDMREALVSTGLYNIALHMPTYVNLIHDLNLRSLPVFLCSSNDLVDNRNDC